MRFCDAKGIQVEFAGIQNIFHLCKIMLIQSFSIDFAFQILDVFNSLHLSLRDGCFDFMMSKTLNYWLVKTSILLHERLD